MLLNLHCQTRKHQHMPRQERTKSGTGIYHVMLRGINKQDIFEDDGIGGDSPRMSSGQKMDHESPFFSKSKYLYLCIW